VHNFELAKDLSAQAMQIARLLEDQPAQARILWIQLLMHDRFGDPRDAVYYGEQALELARRLDLRELLAYILNDLVQTYYNIGKLDLGKQMIEEAIQIWSDIGNKAMLTDSLSNSVMAYYLAGEFGQAIQNAEKAQSIGAEIENLWGQAYSRMFIGLVFLEQGEIQKAIRVMQECLALSKKAGFLAPEIFVNAQLAMVYGELGAFELALQYTEKSFQAMERFSGYWHIYYLNSLAHVYINAGELEKARPIVQQLIEKQGDLAEPGMFNLMCLQILMRFSFADGQYEQTLIFANHLLGFPPKGIQVRHSEAKFWKAKALNALNQVEEALGLFREASQEAEAHSQRLVLWQALAGIAQMEQTRGDSQEADRYRERSAQVIRWIADQIGDLPLRESFLNKPDVHDVLVFSSSSNTLEK
jgi:tetratricopeptide (TPR) repeat protein